MSSTDALSILTLLETAGIQVWLDGGWGIDALLGEETRPHSDLDLVLPLTPAAQTKDLLKSRGFAVTEDHLPQGFAMEDQQGRRVDFHTVYFNAEGAGIQEGRGGSFRYAPEGFKTVGYISGHPVKCLSAQVQADCHYGYEPDESDRRDMELLHERFGIKLLPPYAQESQQQ